MTDLSDLRVDGLLKEFLDNCRHDGDRDLATAALYELHMRVYHGAPLPRDPRETAEDREARAEVGRRWTKRLLVASVALAECRDAIAEVCKYLPEDPPHEVYIRMGNAAVAADAALK